MAVRLNGGFLKRKCVIFDYMGFVGVKMHHLGVKWEMFEEKVCDFQIGGGIFEERIHEFGLNGGFSKGICVMFG